MDFDLRHYGCMIHFDRFFHMDTPSAANSGHESDSDSHGVTTTQPKVTYLAFTNVLVNLVR